MLLTVDIGNTETTIGLYDGSVLKTHWRLTTDSHKTADEYGVNLYGLFRLEEIDPKSVTAAIVSSVVPPLTPAFEQAISERWRITPLIIGPGVKTGVPIRYENPKEVGADRVVNAVAGIKHYGAPLICIDFGTATTFDAISDAGEYLGGAILPGIMISLDALFIRAAKLPRVELVTPKRAIGRNTVESMQSGIVYGVIGQVNQLVKEFKKELGHEAKVVATGGLASTIGPLCEGVDAVDPFLTLEGLRLIYELN